MLISETLHNRIIDGGGFFQPSINSLGPTLSAVIPGIDYTGLILPGTKVEIIQNSIQRYAYVISRVYSGGNTTLNFSNFVNADGSAYTFDTTTITNVYFGNSTIMRNHPIWVSYTPTFAGFSINPTGIYRYCVQGKMIFLNIRMISNGTSNSSTFTITLPINSSNLSLNTSNYWGAAVWDLVDNSALLLNPARAFISGNSNLITVNKDLMANGFTSSGGKRASFQLFYEI